MTLPHIGFSGRWRNFPRRSGLSVSSATLHSITFHNTTASSSTGLVRFGVAFEEADVPSGSVPKVRLAGGSEVRSHAIETVAYADGSIRKATMVADIGTVSASSSQEIEVFARTGSVTASSFTPHTHITGLSDAPTVEIRNHTGSSNNTNVGNLDFDAQTAVGTSTRRTTQADTDLFVRYFVWEEVSPDEHLTCLNYFDFWLDTNGSTVLATEWTPVMSQHWWVDDPFSTAMTKQERTYDATVKWGATTLDTRASLDHAYYNQWASLRDDDDAQHARRHWIDAGSTAMPTLRAVYSDASLRKIIKAGVLPPMDIDDTFAAGSFPTTYTPLGTNGMSSAPTSAGAQVERGLLPDVHGRLLADQSETRWRQARVGAQSILTLHCHVRDHRDPGAGFANGDASMGLLPLPFAELGDGTHSYTGLASEVSATMGSSGTPPTLPDDPAVGGTGAIGTWDEAHAADYAGTIAFLEGERYLLEAVIDQFDMATRNGSYNNIGHNCLLDYGQDRGTRASDLSIPTTKYGSTFRWGQQRNWAPNLLAEALYLVPDDDRHRGYLENYASNYALWIEHTYNGTGSYSGFPADHKNFGGFHYTASSQGPWMSNFSAQSNYRLANAVEGTDRARIIQRAHHDCKYVVRLVENTKYFHTGAYRTAVLEDETDYQNFLPTSGAWEVQPVTIAASTDRLTFFGGLRLGYGLTNGDQLYFSYRAEDLGNLSNVPTEVDTATLYYVQNVSGDTCQISTDSGGSSLVDFTSDYTAESGGTGTVVYVGIDLADYDDQYDPVGSSSSYTPNADSYFSIALSTVHMAWAYSHPDLTQSNYTDYVSWASGIDHSAYSPWAFDGTQIRSTS